MSAAPQEDPRRSGGLLGRIVELRKGELFVTALSGAYFFFLLTSYYILRPLREAEGAERDSTRLKWLFTATCVTMILANPLYGWMVSRLRGPEQRAQASSRPASLESAETGDAWNGMRLVLRSHFLRLVAAHFFIASSIGTVLYFEQNQLVQAAHPDKAARTQLFASI